MRAVRVLRFGVVDDVVVEELPDPEPGPGELVIAVRAAGLNYADVLVVEGSYQNLPEPPFTPGKEAAGTVLAIGPGVERFAPGDRVVAGVEHGTFAERLLVDEQLVVPLPDAVDLTDGAAIGLVGTTAYFGLVRRAGLRSGETVLVTGAGGGVGSAGVGIAKALGARVIALAHDEERARLATEQGADEVLVCPPSRLRDEILARTAGRGVDVVLESVGGDVLTQTIRVTAWEGRIVVVGFASGDQPLIKPGHLLVKNISVHGLQGSDYRDRETAAHRDALADLFRMQAKGDLRIPVERTYPLDEAGTALRRLRDGGVCGKLVLRPTCPLPPAARPRQPLR